MTIGDDSIASRCLSGDHEFTAQGVCGRCGHYDPSKIFFQPKCDRCHNYLSSFGALYFSPPDPDGNVKKRHVCVVCVPVFEALFSKRIDIHGEDSHENCPDPYCCMCECLGCKRAWFALERPKPSECPEHGTKV